MKGIWRYAMTECRDALTRPGDAWAVIALFALAAAIFPLALPAGADLPPQVGRGVVWTSLLVASALSVRGIFDDDMQSGRTEQYVMLLSPAWAMCAIKAKAHWIRHFLPAAPAACAVAQITGAETPLLWLCAAIWTAGAACSCLCVATAALLPPDKGATAAAILLPLYVPALTFGSEASTGDVRALAALAGYALLIFPVCVGVAHFSLRARMGE
ncbi:MAG: heme exporter protein CcmB [Rickettsiales bacterium]